MARSRLAIIRAGFLASAIGVGTVACVPAPVPDDANGTASNVSAPAYDLCNSAGCGDNVNIVVDHDK